MEKMKAENALSRAMALCSRYEKCVKDINDKLVSWGISDPSHREKIINQLIETGFIDEARFAAGYTREKHRINHWGRIKIRVMLSAKGVATDKIELALEEIDTEEYRRTLKDDLLKKKKTVKASDSYELKGKLIRFAQARGYESEIIFSLLSELEI
jgi:regulatory protein